MQESQHLSDACFSILGKETVSEVLNVSLESVKYKASYIW